MSTPKVHNKRHCSAPAGAVYVGRPTKWGNPFSHQVDTLAAHKVATREQAVTAYTNWILTQPQLLQALGELRGKHLVCWCAPASCHADVLLKLANMEET